MMGKDLTCPLRMLHDQCPSQVPVGKCSQDGKQDAVMFFIIFYITALLLVWLGLILPPAFAEISWKNKLNMSQHYAIAAKKSKDLLAVLLKKNKES